MRFIRLTAFALIMGGVIGVQAQQTNYSTSGWTSILETSLPADLRNFLENADEFTLYSLDVDPGFEYFSMKGIRDTNILGQIKIPAGTQRNGLIKALADGISEFEAEHMVMADCFQPHHVIRARKGGVAMDFVICFEGRQIQAFSSKATNYWVFPVSGSPKTIFNQTLGQAGIPLGTD
ncbi:MAG TPA: hypothetical protein VGV18_12855 [Verrucomicrobiae bacterium]|nr:hypothetical protein [Verrucomicrobiae bacterium]